MTWGEVKVVEQRKKFCEAILNEKLSMSEACRQFEISRPTGYLWLKRYQTEGVNGLENLSSARLTQHNQTPREIIKEILDLKHEHSSWGPKKIHGELKNNNPLKIYPGTTAIGNILSRNGLTKKRKVRRRVAEKTSPLTLANGSNDVWCMDFKGWHLTKDSHKFDPFTLTDQYSRFLLRALKLELNTTEHVWAVLDIAFREYGLPLIIRSDNGAPFASTAPGRFSALSVRLVKAGVMPEWIEPGKPNQNGQHERMHLTMEKEGFLPNSFLHDQILHLKKFREYFNFRRPHEALGQVTPGSIYVPSIRPWNGRLQEMEYSSEYQMGKVRSCGKMAWKGSQVYVSPVFHGEILGIKEGADGFEVYFGPYLLGRLINGTELEVKRRPGRIKYKKLIGI